MELKNAIILPKTSDQKLITNYYSMADAFVICSKRENFPTTCIEAQCCGTPVIGFDTGGTKETSLYGDKYFVPYGDIDALAEKVIQILQKNHKNLSMIAQQRYSKEAMYKNYLDEYNVGGEKKRVLLIDVNCKYSSTGKIVYDLMKSLQRDGHTAAVCYGRGKDIDEPFIYKFGIDWETCCHAVMARITGYNGCFSPLSTRRLIKFIDDFRPDIIHIHELHAYFVNIKMLLEYIKRKHIKVVWTFHCEYMYTGKCGHAFECDRFRSGCGDCSAIRDYPKSLFFDKTRQMLAMKEKCFEGMDLSIVTPSQWLADRVKLSFLKNVPIRVIHNGIDTTVFKHSEVTELKKRLNIPNENKVVLALAPNIMGEIKGGQWVLKLAEKMKDENITFVLVGDTSIK